MVRVDAIVKCFSIDRVVIEPEVAYFSIVGVEPKVTFLFIWLRWMPGLNILYEYVLII